MQNSHIESEIQKPKKIRDAKILGGIGAILALLGAIPNIGWLLALAGITLVLIAVKKIADITGRKGIFHDYIKAFIFGVANLIILFLFIGALMVDMMNMFTSFGFGMHESGVSGLGVKFIPIIFIFFVFGIITAYFHRRSFRKITEETGEKLFATTGDVYFIGAILLIILVGFLIQLIGSIMEIVAFFSLPDELPEKSALANT